MFLLTAAEATATATFTTMHLILIAILIVLVIGAMLWGARQKSARAAGEREEARRTDALLAHPTTESAVSPAPPPLGDSGMTQGAALQPTTPKPAATKPTAKQPAAKAASKPEKAVLPAAKSTATSTPVAKAISPKPAVKAAPKPAKPAPAEPVSKAPVPKAAPAITPAAPKAAAKPKTATPAPAASAYGLIDVKGLGPKAVPLLEAQGVRDLATLAALSPTRAIEIDAGLGALSGRMARDRWIDQAKLLAVGDVAGFEATYGTL